MGSKFRVVWCDERGDVLRERVMVAGDMRGLFAALAELEHPLEHCTVTITELDR